MKKYLFALALSTAFITPNVHAQEPQCGTIEMVTLAWQSSELLTYVDAYILEHGLGCEVTISVGDSIPTMTSMVERQQPDVTPELSLTAAFSITDPALKEGRIITLDDSLVDGNVESWWIPQYIVDDYPEIRTVADVLKRPDLFPAPEDASRGAVMVGPEGWGGSVITEQFYKAFGFADAGFDLVYTGSSAGLESAIAAAYERRKGYISYYWTPTALLARYPMVRLRTGVAHDAQEWERCTTVALCPDPKPNDYPEKTLVPTWITKNFAERTDAREALDYFTKRGWGDAEVSKMLLWMQENQATGEQGATYFLKNYPEVWKQWVSAEVAAKVEASL